MKIIGYIFLAVYIIGHWCYGAWYIWENYAGYSFGILAWYAFMRAIIWPVWVVLEFVN